MVRRGRYRIEHQPTLSKTFLRVGLAEYVSNVSQEYRSVALLRAVTARTERHQSGTRLRRPTATSGVRDGEQWFGPILLAVGQGLGKFRASVLQAL